MLKEGQMTSVERIEQPSESIDGVLILDLDGTLTLPKSKYALDKRTLADISEFIGNGGVCALNTGATKERAERTFLTPIFGLLDERYGFDKATEIFIKKIWLLPENGSSILKSTGVTIMENELWFLWNETDPLHVPDKEKLRNLIETILVPKIPESFVIGDRLGEIGRRNYILSWKGLKNVPALIDMIKEEIIPQSKDIINWDGIEMKAARTTIDFINAKSGKEPSTRKFLSMVNTDGPIVGFGDLGDEFAKIPQVTTFNVNAEKPNSFRSAKIPALDVANWIPINASECIITNNRVFLNGKEIEVIRDEHGDIVLDITRKNRLFMIDPITKGAGEATAEMLERLIKIGYFAR